MRLSAAFLIVLTGIGCTSTTPAAGRVRVTSNDDAVKGCEYLGEVNGSDRMWGGWAGQGIAEKNAYARLKNNAASMGADTVLLVTEDTGTSGSIYRGEAYRCAE